MSGTDSPAPAAAPVSPWRWWGVALALWLVLAAAAGAALWQLRRDALEAQTRELGLLSLALSDEIDRGLRGLEEGLQAVRGELQQGRLPVSGPLATEALRTRADLMPLASALSLSDRAGHVVASSDPDAGGALSSFGTRLHALPADGLALADPLPDVGDGAVAALALRADGVAALPGGWILAAMPARLLLGAFTVASPAPDAGMAVFRGDGEVLAAANQGPLTQAQVEAGTKLGRIARAELVRLPGERDRLLAVHDLRRYGIKVVVVRDLDAMLRAWRQTAEAAALTLLLLLLVLVAAVHFALLANRRRVEAQRAAQAQRARASRLEALGTLAGGVANDFNNVLAAIVGYGEMARDAAAAGTPQARHLDRVLQAALRGKALVERILSVSRGGARASTVFALEPVVEEVLALLSASLRPGIVLERALEAPDARLRGDPTRVFEAVMNLCTNALQAMPQGGMLSVGVRRVHVEEARVLSHSSLAPGSYLALGVADQGKGITPEVAEHLFEPFFTTRTAQSGTGLGLALVHGVVAEFNGAIDVQGAPGRGARFTLYLPECTEEAGPALAAPPATAAGAGQALLVVDDQPELVAMTQELLAGLGYQATGFTDPSAALAALRAQPARFAALVTDEVMPGLSGTALAEAARAASPGLPVLLVSGYGGLSLAQRAAAAGVRRVLAKPLQRAELAAALAEVLREDAGPAPASLHLSSAQPSEPSH
jgi:signal transduction histidine kinase/CheY-like chemotaxis protein